MRYRQKLCANRCTTDILTLSNYGRPARHPTARTQCWTTGVRVTSWRQRGATSTGGDDSLVRSLSAPASGEALPMNQQVEGYRMHRVLSNLSRLDVDQLDDADRERVETARDLLEEVSILTRPEDGSRPDAPTDD